MTPRFHWQRRPFVTAIAIAAATVISGCSIVGDESAAVDLDVDAVPDRSHWVLPLNEYYAVMALNRYTYTRDVVIHQCLAEQDVPYPEARLLDDFVSSVTSNDVGRRLFDVDLASEYGYGGPGATDAGVRQREEDDMRRFQEATASGAGRVAAEQCLKQADSAVPYPPDVGIVEELIWVASGEAQEDRDVHEAMDRWTECMELAGIPDLPDSPFEMPTEVMSDSFRDGPRVPDEPRPWKPPSAMEIEMAVTDAQCREDSGFAQTLYEKEWDAQVELMSDKMDTLEDVLVANQEYEDALERVLAELE